MARIVGGFITFVGLILAGIAAFNVYFADGLIIGQVVVGVLGLIAAFALTATFQEHPMVQRILAIGMLILAFLMCGPIIYLLFVGKVITFIQIITALAGFVLLYLTWRMLPR